MPKNTKNKKIHIFNKYAIWNLVYSIICSLAIMFGIIYAAAYDNNQPFLYQLGGTWFYMTLGFLICLVIVFFIVNISFSVSGFKNAVLSKNKYGIIAYSFGLLIPYVGMSYEVYYRKKLINQNKLKITIENKKKHSKVFIGIREFFRYTGILLGLFILLIPSLIICTSITQYFPDSSLRLKVDDTRTTENKENHSALSVGDSYSALTYNTGFGAYNQNMHFFMDGNGQFLWGGQGTAESKQAVYNSLQGIDRVLSANHDNTTFVNSWDKDAKAMDLRGSNIYKTTYDDQGNPTDSRIDYQTLNQDLNDGTFDFIDLQELDIDATRSCFINEYDYIRNLGISTDGSITDPASLDTKISDMYNSTFAYNFAVPFIPAPLNDMHGQVLAGLAVFSKYTILDNDTSYPTRESLANITTFPLNMFELKRAMNVTRYPVKNGKEFVFINCHFSAYDDSGSIRRKQLLQVNQLFNDEIAKGNYVILGADWNQTLPGCYGYEGSDVEGTNDPNDPAIAPWDYEEFKYSKSNAKNPNLIDDYVQYNDYEIGKTYKKGDVVRYFSDNDKTMSTLDSVQYYMKDSKTHLYEVTSDSVSLPPLDENGNKNDGWRYYLEPVNSNISLTKKVREELLPISLDTSSTGATIYSIHAIPTLRNAGTQYFNESSAAYTEEGEYKGGHVYKGNIDGFLVSNNIKVEYTFGLDTNFKYSDHNPVGIKFTLL